MYITSCTVIRSLTQAVLLCAVVAGSAQAQQGTITGRVTDAISGRAVAPAQVTVVGTNIGVQANSQGQYTLRGVSAGTVEVRAVLVGFAEQRQTATVPPGGTVTVDFQMRQVAVTLAPVVTTATGEQRRVEVGNAIAQVDAAEDRRDAAVSNMGDLLIARAPASGRSAARRPAPARASASAARARSRSRTTRSTSSTASGSRARPVRRRSSVGGTTPARVGDINPEEIENIEIVRGPSASTLYGTDAANGVIVITTKRGVAGKPQWTYYTEQTAHHATTTTIRRRSGAGAPGTTAATTSTASNTVQCFLSQVGRGRLRAGQRHDVTTCTTTGVDAVRHRLPPAARPPAARRLRDASATSCTASARTRTASRRCRSSRSATSPRTHVRCAPRQASPNHLNRVTARANFNITLAPNADLAINAGYISQDLRLPMSDDSGVNGIAANTYGGPGFKYNLNAAGDTLYGWRQFTPRDIYQQYTNQAIERLITSASANWRPARVARRCAATSASTTSTAPTRSSAASGTARTAATDRLGLQDRQPHELLHLHARRARGTATRRLLATLESKTTAGVQYYRNLFDRNGASGRARLPRARRRSPRAATKTADEATTESRTLGGFVEENIAIPRPAVPHGRRSLGPEQRVRRGLQDACSIRSSRSRGSSRDESFFPTSDFLNQLRLRTAYGASGVQPGTTDAVQFYSSTTARGESGDVTGVVFSTLGNRNLKPERSTELELGIDGTLLEQPPVDRDHVLQQVVEGRAHQPRAPAVARHWATRRASRTSARSRTRAGRR